MTTATSEKNHNTLYIVGSETAPQCLERDKTKNKALACTNAFTVHDLSFTDLSAMVKEKFEGIVVISISSRNELAHSVKFLMSVKKELKERSIIPVIFMETSDQKKEDLLLKAGCGEVLKYNLTAKAFVHKLSRYVTLMKQNKSSALDQDTEFRARSITASTDEERTVDSKPQSAKGAENVKNLDRGTIKGFPPLTASWDFWLLKNKKMIKKIQGRWLVELVGPPPSVGRWAKDPKTESKSEDTKWTWESRSPSSDFNLPNGTWVFFGRKPEYSWVVNRWAFVSNAPSLEYIEQGNVVDFRFKLNPPSCMGIRKNSTFALQHFPKIKEMIDNEYHLTAEEVAEKNLHVSMGKEGSDIPWNDRIDTKTMKDTDWNLDDLSYEEEEMPWNDHQSGLPEGGDTPWNSKLGTPDKDTAWGRKLGSAESESHWGGSKITPADEKEFKKTSRTAEEEKYNFKMGAEAMEACGVGATLNGEETSIVGYTDDPTSILISFKIGIAPKSDKVQLRITAQNLEMREGFPISGDVIEWTEDVDSGQVLAHIKPEEKFKKIMGSLQEAVAKRQEEIFAFLKKTKGVE